MESRDLVSVSRPILRISVSKVSSLVSISKAAGLETLNISKKCHSKISITQQLLFVVFAAKKQPKPVGKILEIWKKIGKMHKFWSLQSQDFWWSLGLEVFTRSRFRRLRSRLHHITDHQFCILELTLRNTVI